VPILIKCNASDVTSEESFSVSLLVEKRIELTDGDDVFIWTSEHPRQKPNGKGLQAQGKLLSSRRSGAKASLSIQISTQLSGHSLGMDELARVGKSNLAAHALHDRIRKFRQRRVWALNEEERRLLNDFFESDERNKDSALDIDVALYELKSFEGSSKLRQHLVRERNVSLIKTKKLVVFKKTGSLACEVCCFDFKKYYGSIGKDFCEVHHKSQLHKGERTTQLSDLAILCANCHRMIHKTEPMMSLDEFRGAYLKDLSGNRIS
jgi:predicted HNH restriction endonuclease